MRSTLFTIASILCFSTVATSLPSTSTASPTTTKPPICLQDNCLNQINHQASNALAFCQTYTKTINTLSAAVPTYLPACSSSPSRVSSACSCMLYTGTSSSTTSKATTSSSSSSSSSPIKPSTTKPPVCNQDNCLNQVNHQLPAAGAFCKNYTTTINSDPSAIPTYLPACQLSPSRVSSACTCLAYTATTASPTTSGTPTCSAGSDPEINVNVLPAPNPNIDPTSYLNLAVSKFATLYYAQASPGTTVLEVEYAMKFPQVTLEDSNQVSTASCTTSGTILVTVSSQQAFLVVSNWPSSNFVVITDSDGCNPINQRGVYLVSSYILDSKARTATLQVIPQTWTDVANTMEVSYGTSVSGSNANLPLTPSCTPAQASATPTGTSTNSGTSYADLTPEEKRVVAFLMKDNVYDANNNIVAPMPPVLQQPVVPSPFDPNPDPAQQAATEDAFKKAGLPSPGAMHDTTTSALAGHCANNAYIPATSRRDLFALTSAPQSPSPLSLRRSLGRDLTERDWTMLMKREGIDDETWWKWVWEIGCNEIFGAVVDALDEDAGALLELICKLKELYDSVHDAYEQRDAIKCALNGCVFQLPPSTYWDYTYSWNAKYTIPPQTLASSAVGTVSCVDCSLTVSEIKFQGRVMIVLSTGQIQSAYMTPTVSWSGNLVMGMVSTGAFSGNWNYNFNQLAFPGPVTVPNEFTISPSMMFGLGVQWSTDSAVNMVGGATVSINGGTMALDFMAQTAQYFNNWFPNVQYTYPTFKTPSKVTWNPIMRSSISIGVSILNSPYKTQPIYINSATSIGFNAALIDSNSGQCNAGQLMMTSYSNVQNSVNFNGANVQQLGPSGNVVGSTKCFTVPNDNPTRDEINSLRSVGSVFCTSYLGYRAPLTIAYGVSTLTTPTTVPTTIPTTISTASTIYVSPTILTVSTQQTIVQPTSYIYTAGTQSLGDQFRKKRGLEMPVATTLGTATRQAASKITASPSVLAKRQVAAPAMISTWDNTKVSLACSQIATGTSTSTYFTSTTTSFSGTMTSTVYSTVDVLGQLVTKTNTQYIRSVTITTVTQGATVTVATASSCPIQTQASCFRLTGHGAPHIDGKQLMMYYNDAFAAPIFGGYGWGWIPATFYLTCAGVLVNIETMKAIIPARDDWVEFLTQAQGGFTANAPTCTLDPGSKTMVCGGVGWYSFTPFVTSSFGNTLPWQPVWSDGVIPGGNFGFTLGPLTPIVMTYEEVVCPCVVGPDFENSWGH